MSARSDLPATSEDLSRALANVPEDQRTWVNRSCPVTHALACLPAQKGTDPRSKITDDFHMQDMHRLYQAGCDDVIHTLTSASKTMHGAL